MFRESVNNNVKYAHVVAWLNVQNDPFKKNKMCTQISILKIKYQTFMLKIHVTVGTLRLKTMS